jgi:hypothetical protein
MRDKKSFGGWLVGPFLLLLSTACGFGPQSYGSGSVNGSGTSGSFGTSSGATSSGNPSGTGTGSGAPSGSGSSGGGVSGEPLDGGGDDGTAFTCPDVPTADMPVPGTCSAPADLRCPYPKLSQTGCVNSNNPLQLADVVIPYEVNSPLWSDGALKSRGMRIPTGGKIHVKNCTTNPAECCVQDPNNFTPDTCLPDYDDGKWVFPVGTVMVKNFMFPDASQPSSNKLVETRLFIHVSDVTAADGGVQSTWIGYGYQWNEAQTEATVTSNYAYDEESTASFTLTAGDGGTQALEWHYPSRAECLQCHQPITPTGGYTLGPETIQMNRIMTGDTVNQIDKLAAMNLFDTPPTKPYDAALVAPYPGQVGSPPAGATLEQRARSYLHANCSFCHRPDGQASDWMDMRYDAPLQNTGLCGVAPSKPVPGESGAFILAPGDPMNSTLWQRMDALPGNADAGDLGRMPAIASFVLDEQALELMSNWITSITSCPPM